MTRHNCGTVYHETDTDQNIIEDIRSMLTNAVSTDNAGDGDNHYAALSDDSVQDIMDAVHELTVDALTGLPGVRQYRSEKRRIERIIGRDQAENAKQGRNRNHPGGANRFAVAVIDMNGLKEINDRTGHSAGDLSIQHVASELRHSLRPTDHLFRVGGDEFILLAALGDEDDAGSVIGRIVNRYVGPSISVGVSAVGPTSDRFDIAQDVADGYMYKAKQGRADLPAGRGYYTTRANMWNNGKLGE